MKLQDTTDSSISFPLWPVILLCILCFGEPDLLDAIIQWVQAQGASKC
jgi:hypothetical protein